MASESFGKTIEFIIEGSDDLNAMMMEEGYLQGIATLDSEWDDTMITPYVSSHITLIWYSITDSIEDGDVLTGEDYDMVRDHIFEKMKESDLVLLEECVEADLSDYQTKSIREMLDDAVGVIPPVVRRDECGNCTAFNGCACFTVFKGVPNEYVNETFYCKAFERRIRKGESNEKNKERKE